MRRPGIERLLPTVYQRTAVAPGVLGALLDTMEAMHAPTERTLAAVDNLFAPYRAPDRMVPFLLSWVALDHVLAPPDTSGPATTSAIPTGRLRDLLAVGASIARRRGTATGLRAVVTVAVGAAVTVEEPPDRPFHVIVRIPLSAADLL